MITIDDLMRSLPAGAYIAGGAARAHIMKARFDVDEPVRDVDLFFRDADARVIATQMLEHRGWIPEPIPESNGNSKTMRMRHPDAPWPVDVVDGRYRDDVQSLLESFDYRACMFGWSLVDGYVIGAPEAAEDAIARRLVLRKINGSAVRTMDRAARYAERGWSLDPESAERLTAAAKKEVETGIPAGSEPY